MILFPGLFGSIAASLKKLLNWNNESILFGSLARNSNDQFSSISINSSGDSIIVGAKSDEKLTGLSDIGLAYIFKKQQNIWVQEAILSASIGVDTGDEFGSSVSINSNGNRVAIGVRLDERIGQLSSQNEGLAYIYTSGSNGWISDAILSGSRANTLNDQFGFCIDINSVGNRVVIGAPQDEGFTTTATPGSTGSIYTFNLRDTYGDGWNGGQMQVREGVGAGTVIATLQMFSGAGPTPQYVTLVSGTTYNLYFSVAGSFPSEARVEIIDPNGLTIYNQTAAATVGTILHTWTAISGSGTPIISSSSLPDASGVAYVFSSGSSGWVEEAILSGSLATGASDSFGFSVAINSLGNRIVAGAIADEKLTGLSDIGLGYVFTSGTNGWFEEAILSGSLAAEIYDSFGYSVDINSAGNRIIIGAYSDEVTLADSGVAYIFTSGTNGWFEEARLTGSLANNNNDFFGISVGINSIGNIAIIGASLDESLTGDSNTGLAYIYVSGASGWIEKQILSASYNNSNDAFGSFVSINSSGEIVLISSPYDEVPNTLNDSEGLVYVYDSTKEQIINNFTYSIDKNFINFGDLGTGSFPNSSSNVLLNVPSEYLYSPKKTTATIAVSSSIINSFTVSPSTIVLTPAFGGINTNITATYSPNSSGQTTGLITISSSLGINYVSVTGSATIERWVQDKIFTGSQSIDFNDQFGTSISTNTSGNYIIIGVPNDERLVGNSNVGLAYIFNSSSNGWTEQVLLSGSLSVDTTDSFGVSVAINSSGNRVVVGAFGDETTGSISTFNNGLAYVFTSGSNGWLEEARLSGSFATGSSDNFGNSVAINSIGNIIAIGAQSDEGTPPNLKYPETTYLFNLRDTFGDGWNNGQMQVREGVGAGTVIATLQMFSGAGPTPQYVTLVSGTTYNLYFSVGGTYPAEPRVEIIDPNGLTIYNQTAAATVGTILHTWTAISGTGLPLVSSNDSSGIVYIFNSSSNGWIQEQALTGSLSFESNDNFGSSLSINSIGNRVVVGAINDETSGSSSTFNNGLAYVFTSGTNGWFEEARLSASLVNIHTLDEFGSSVSINSSGNRIIVGAKSDERLGQIASQNEGLAYVFTSGSNGWFQEAILSGSLAISFNDQFGISVSMNSQGDFIVIGAINDGSTISGAGLAYVFASGTNGWIEKQILSGSLGNSGDSFGRSVALSSNGDKIYIGAPNDERASGSPTPAQSEGLVYEYQFRKL